MSRRIRLWWLAAGGMVILFGLSCLLDYVRNFTSFSGGSAPYWAYVAARAIEFLLPAFLFALIALFLQWKEHRSKKQAADHSCAGVSREKKA